MSRLHAFGELTPAERQEYIANMNAGVDNRHIKIKVDKLCGVRVRPKTGFKDRIMGFLNPKKEEERELDKKTTKKPSKKKKEPVPEPVIEPEPTVESVVESKPVKPAPRKTTRKRATKKREEKI